MTGSNKQNSAFANVLFIGFVAGTLDGLAAIIWNYKVPAASIFKYIASAVFGKAAFAGGTKMILWGVLFHYGVAYIFTAVFFLSFPLFISVLKNKYVTAIAFGLITWLIMNLLVVPATQIGAHPLSVKNIVSNAIILILCIGLPVALLSARAYAGRRLKRSKI
jgi:hypothetical protein